MLHMKVNASLPKLCLLRILLLLSGMGCSQICTSQTLGADLSLAQYGRITWRIEDGGLPGKPATIAQTTDGYLWVGTDAGLFRFDGIRFVPWTKWPAGIPPQPGIVSLLGTRDGSLWVTSRCCKARIRNGEMTQLTIIGRPNQFVEDQNGNVWFARTRAVGGPLCRMGQSNDTYECYGPKDGMKCLTGQSIAIDGTGTIWTGSNPGICSWARDHAGYYAPAADSIEAFTSPATSALVNYGSSGMLVSYAVTGPHLGLQLLSPDGQLKSFDVGGLRGNEISVSALLNDSKGDLWIGTTGQGLYHVSGGIVDHFTQADGLSADDVNTLYEDREGNVWMGNSEGLTRFHLPKAVTFTLHQGLISNEIYAVATKNDGTIAVGGRGGLQIVHGDKVTSFHSGQDFSGQAVHALLYDHAGTLWVITDQQLGTIESGRFVPIRTVPGLATTVLLSLAEDSQHEMWVATTKGILRVEAGVLVPQNLGDDQFRIFPDPKDGVWIMSLSGTLEHVINGIPHIVYTSPTKASLAGRFRVEPNGDIWAWNVSGLRYWAGKFWRVLDAKSGLPCDVIYTTIDDDKGNMWIFQPCGISVLPYAQLSAWAQQSTTRVSPTFTIDRTDGARGGFNDFGTTDAFTKDGRLLFANEGLLQVVDTKRISFNSIQPPVHIEQLFADHQPFPTKGSVVLPALTRDLQIDYTALSLVVPQRVRFRYRLSSVDKDWQDAGVRRQAFYMNLSPGTYTFTVVACNNDGLWNLQGDSIKFTIVPAIYQRLWFRLLIVFLCVLVAWAFFTYRLNLLGKRLQDHLATRYQERLRIARDLHDTLLQGIYGLTLGFQVVMSKVSGNEDAKMRLDEVLVSADNTLKEGRQRLQSLRSETSPIDLATDFSRIAETYKLHSSSEFTITVSGAPRVLNPLVWEEVHWIGKEALANAFRHAKAAHIETLIEYGSKELRINFRDDGVGIDSEVLIAGSRPDHWGLSGMRERARLTGGHFALHSRDPEGTLVEFSMKASLAYEKNGTLPFWERLRNFRRNSPEAN